MKDYERPIIPFIAETGGINAMIVIRPRLPALVVDVVTSAFRSAGQRCSALRVLLLQEEIAERTLAMLAGARRLDRRHPADPSTDVGPVIDQGAYDRLTLTARRALRWIATVDSRRRPFTFHRPLSRSTGFEDVRRNVRAAAPCPPLGKLGSSLKPWSGSTAPALALPWASTAALPRRRDGREAATVRQSLRQPLR